MGILGKKKEIGPDTVLQRNNEILFNEVDGEVVMLSVEIGEYFSLNSIGYFIWKILEKRVTFSDLIGKLLDAFNVPKEKCIADTIDFLKILNDKNLIKLV